MHVLLLSAVTELCVKFCIVYGDRYEFRDWAPTADGVLLLDELAMMMYDAMDFASETGSLQGPSTADRR